ncbi:hypothetical protein ARMSODRAFT_668050 [Armillaria solidipes]|uniref:Uncharacterized protein n=1 Tax=Armillaria solidipes TaxID=1076256 RepID=A0A2H3BBS8_9AGAR|nr:hypothetical protein ARMSODRAFT_668050 [Armillaria solidipes]
MIASMRFISILLFYLKHFIHHLNLFSRNATVYAACTETYYYCFLFVVLHTFCSSPVIVHQGWHSSSDQMESPLCSTHYLEISGPSRTRASGWDFMNVISSTRFSEICPYRFYSPLSGNVVIW